MAIRIYALAKELEIDNKKLVDICARAGITGKGSALASLTDEEEVRVRSLIVSGKGGRSEAGTPPKAGAGAPRSIRREDYIAPAGSLPGSKVPVLPASKPDKPPLLRKKPEEPPSERPEPAPVIPMVATPSVAPEPVMPVAPAAEPLAAVAKATSTEADPAESARLGAPERPLTPAAKPRLRGGPQPPLAPQRPVPSMPRPLDRLLGKRGQEVKPSEKKPGEKESRAEKRPALRISSGAMP